MKCPTCVIFICVSHKGEIIDMQLLWNTNLMSYGCEVVRSLDYQQWPWVYVLVVAMMMFISNQLSDEVNQASKHGYQRLL